MRVSQHLQKVVGRGITLLAAVSHEVISVTKLLLGKANTDTKIDRIAQSKKDRLQLQKKEMKSSGRLAMHRGTRNHIIPPAWKSLLGKAIGTFKIAALTTAGNRASSARSTNITPLCSVLMRAHLHHCIQASAPNTR